MSVSNKPPVTAACITLSRLMSKSPPVKTPVATCEITELTAAEKAAAEAPLKPTVEERADPTPAPPKAKPTAI